VRAKCVLWMIHSKRIVFAAGSLLARVWSPAEAFAGPASPPSNEPSSAWMSFSRNLRRSGESGGATGFGIGAGEVSVILL
jgi:hypothetical protein